MRKVCHTGMNPQICEEACDWIVQHRASGLDEAAKHAFDAWLRASPEHVRAYLEMYCIWEDTAALNPNWNADAEQLVALARAAADNVVPLDLAPGKRSDESLAVAARATGRWRPFPRLLTTSIAFACFVGVLFGWLNRYPSYATSIGEQRSIILTDGSTIDLNACSQIRVRYSEHERLVELLEGQALFRVAKDRQRPFVVRSAGTAVRAVGTQFDVYRKKSGLTITVLEGRVAVLNGQQPHVLAEADNRRDSGAPAALTTRQRAGKSSESVATRPEGVVPSDTQHDAVFASAGEQLMVTPTAIDRRVPRSVAAATAWTQHRLVFEFAPLSEVVEEFNRYNARPLVIDSDDRDLVDFHVSGAFSSADPAVLLRFLRAQPGIAVVEGDRQIRISKK